MNIDDTAMKSVVAKAILDSLTPEARASLIENSIKSLLNERAGTGYGAKSVLQDTFDRAVTDVARSVASEMLVTDATIKERIRKLFLDAYEKMVDGNDAYPKLVEKVASAFERALTGDRY